MLSVLSLFIRIVLFSVLVLVIGNSVHYDGLTVSDQIKLKMAHAERSSALHTVRTWARKITLESRSGSEKKASAHKVVITPPIQEEFSASEREKLKALIQELNSSHRKD